ncbi:hypothetical protein ACLMJK_003915 [Lecanora helva]
MPNANPPRERNARMALGGPEGLTLSCSIQLCEAVCEFYQTSPKTALVVTAMFVIPAYFTVKDTVKGWFASSEKKRKIDADKERDVALLKRGVPIGNPQVPAQLDRQGRVRLLE